MRQDEVVATYCARRRAATVETNREHLRAVKNAIESIAIADVR